jgi:hypothetical protein
MTDHNPLVNYAVNNSSSVAAMVGNTKTEAEKAAILEEARKGAVYSLDDAILTTQETRQRERPVAVDYCP